MQPAVVRCEKVRKTFPALKGKEQLAVFENITFDVKHGEFLVLLGPGQCGKTTLLNIIAGHDFPTGGAAYENGKPITGAGPTRGMVYQDTRLFPWLTVQKNVEYGPAVRGEKRQIYSERAREYIKLVGLTGFEKHYPVKLSGGMKQRAGIARVYCNEPNIILMDEPFGALDAQTRYMMQEELEKLWRIKRNTVLFVTNNIEEALFLGDRIIVLSRRPSRIKAEYAIDFPRPRCLTSPAFLALRKEIGGQIEINF